VAQPSVAQPSVAQPPPAVSHVVLELEEQSANRKLAPADWARAARHSAAKGYGFRHWEIGNEVYLRGGRSGPMGDAFPTPEDYIAHAKAVSAAVKSIQPDAQIGLSINWGDLKWGTYVMQQAAGSYDFVVPHLYVFGNSSKMSFESAALTENFRVLDRAAKLNAMTRTLGSCLKISASGGR
jgi:hypothetical protein